MCLSADETECGSDVTGGFVGIAIFCRISRREEVSRGKGVNGEKGVRGGVEEGGREGSEREEGTEG